MPPRVLVVDDNEANRSLIEGFLHGVGCDLVFADTGSAALTLAKSIELDLVLLDVQMPGMDGFEVCRRLKSMRLGALLPVVMITALHETEDRVKALHAGADDFLSKPVERFELVARVTSALRLKAVYDTLDSAEEVIFSLAAAVEAKDSYTEKHTRRVADTARRIGAGLRLTAAEQDALFRGGMVHDVGKIGVPDSILHKPGPLNGYESAAMRAHTLIGEDIVRPLRTAALLLPIIRHHHERYDGGGYPDRLRASEIPMLARIVGVCDAYDALVSDRPYRSGRSRNEAVAVLKDGAGTQWDPKVVDTLVDLLPSLPTYWAA